MTPQEQSNKAVLLDYSHFELLFTMGGAHD